MSRDKPYAGVICRGGHGEGIPACGKVSRTHPGATRLHRWSAADILAGAAVFAASLELWKLLKGYDPAFTELEQAA